MFCLHYNIPYEVELYPTGYVSSIFSQLLVPCDLIFCYIGILIIMYTYLSIQYKYLHMYHSVNCKLYGIELHRVYAMIN